MKKYQVILFQPYLRRFVLNFERGLKYFSFKQVARPPKVTVGYHMLESYEKEIIRTKDSWQVKIRRLLGIPNIRIRLDRQGDVFFTYACLVIGFKPYCTYIETGLALYNYDLKIAKNPLARFWVMFVATRANCKRLIFISEAAKRSFFSTVHYPAPVRKILEAKSQVIYPIPIAKQSTMSPRKFSGHLKLLFPGTFYMKGGIEIAHAYERLRRKYENITLTVITALHVVRQEDQEYLCSLPGLTLLDAKLNEQQMISIYQSHDIFLLPTYRDGFGLVLIEALAYGMPLIITDQYATSEMIRDGKNGFIFRDHPLKDYNPQTYEILGRYYNPKDFYTDLLRLQKEGKLKSIEDFLVASVSQFLENPKLLEQFSRESLELYRQKFDAESLTKQIEEVFLSSLEA